MLTPNQNPDKAISDVNEMNPTEKEKYEQLLKGYNDLKEKYPSTINDNNDNNVNIDSNSPLCSKCKGKILVKSPKKSI